MNSDNRDSAGNMSSGYSAGFSWGFKSESSSKHGQHVAAEGGSECSTDNIHYKYRAKRKYSSGNEGQDDRSRHSRQVTNRGKHMISKRKAHVVANIQGQALPIQRGLELMSKEELQNTLLEMMKSCPETQQVMNNKLLECNFSIDKCEQLLRSKLEQLYQSIPYTRSAEMSNLNDYAFVRMKPYIMEFLNCVVDCILDQIPPRVENLLQSLNFLNTCTDMITSLPRFQLPSNNYYYDKCLEQLSYVWCTVIEHIARDVFLALNGETVISTWVSKLELYNELSNGILVRPLQLFKSLTAVDSEYLSNKEVSPTTMNPLQNSTDRLANNQ